MEHITPLDILEGQIRECFGRVVYSHKTHEKCADMLLSKLSALKHIQIALSVLVSGGLVSVIISEGKTQEILAAVFSALLLGLNLYFKNYNFGQLAQAHKETADRLWMVRESYLSLIADIVARLVTDSQATHRRDELQRELGAIYNSAPRTNSPAYIAAQKALKHREDLTFSPDELDAFLPERLRIKRRS